MLKLIFVALVLAFVVVTPPAESLKLVKSQKLIITPPPALIQQVLQAFAEKKNAIQGLVGQALDAKSNFQKSLASAIQQTISQLPPEITLKKTPYYTKTIILHGAPSKPSTFPPAAPTPTLDAESTPLPPAKLVHYNFK